MFGLEPKDYFAITLGGAGLILSIAIWVRTIIRETRRLSVSVSPAFHAFANGEVSTQIASLNVLNRGSRPAHVKAPTVLAPDGNHLSFVGVDDFKRFPKKLEDGESASLCVAYSEIARTLKKQGCKGTVTLYPACLDATGKRHWGRRWKFDVDKKWSP
jgi:hypothetical protein